MSWLHSQQSTFVFTVPILPQGTVYIHATFIKFVEEILCSPMLCIFDQNIVKYYCNLKYQISVLKDFKQPLCKAKLSMLKCAAAAQTLKNWINRIEKFVTNKLCLAFFRRICRATCATHLGRAQDCCLGIIAYIWVSPHYLRMTGWDTFLIT